MSSVAHRAQPAARPLHATQPQLRVTGPVWRGASVTRASCGVLSSVFPWTAAVAAGSMAHTMKQALSFGLMPPALRGVTADLEVTPWSARLPAADQMRSVPCCPLASSAANL